MREKERERANELRKINKKEEFTKAWATIPALHLK
jgi:hypothetical protein